MTTPKSSQDLTGSTTLPALYFVKRPNPYTARVVIPKRICDIVHCKKDDVITLEVSNPKLPYITVVFSQAITSDPPAFTLPFDVRVTLDIEQECDADANEEPDVPTDDDDQAHRKLHYREYPPLQFRIIWVHRPSTPSANRSANHEP